MKFKHWLNEATQEDFWALASLQRDKPESAMLKVQHAMSGGVLNPVVEHIGDLIHRMTERPTFQWAGYEYVKDKVEKTLRYLTNPYGFGKEMSENIANNAPYLGLSPEALRSKIYSALELYAQEHERLPTYNEAQKLAQLAAVAVGRLKFDMAVRYLRELQKHLKTKHEWVAFAHQGLTASSVDASALPQPVQQIQPSPPLPLKGQEGPGQSP